MSYLMRRLVVDELRLRDTFEIIRTYLAGFETGEVSIPNFSHYNEHGEHAIRLRADYRDNQVKQKALGLLDQLVTNGYINEYLPSDDWVNKDDAPVVNRNACVKAFQCASAISDLTEFENITENNPIPQNFLTCFLDQLFQEIGIDLHFRPNEIQRIMERDDLQNVVSNSINAVTPVVEFNINDFTNPIFFKRFRHMIGNNLLVHPNGENRFRNLFYMRNRRNNESEDETIQRFCEELAVT